MRVIPIYRKLKTLTVILYPRYQIEAAAGSSGGSYSTSANPQEACVKLIKRFHSIPINQHFTPVRTMSHETRNKDSNQKNTEEGLVRTSQDENDRDDLKSIEDELKKVEEAPVKQLGAGEKLKLAIRDYGGTVLVFHVTMSLMSLGSCYLLVSSGLDIVGLLSQIGISESILESKIAQGGSTFVLAYAIHKVFAPLRLGITLTAVPFIVKKLRAIGFLKKPAV